MSTFFELVLGAAVETIAYHLADRGVAMGRRDRYVTYEGDADVAAQEIADDLFEDMSEVNRVDIEELADTEGWDRERGVDIADAALGGGKAKLPIGNRNYEVGAINLLIGKGEISWEITAPLPHQNPPSARWAIYTVWDDGEEATGLVYEEPTAEAAKARAVREGHVAGFGTKRGYRGLDAKRVNPASGPSIRAICAGSTPIRLELTTKQTISGGTETTVEGIRTLSDGEDVVAAKAVFRHRGDGTLFPAEVVVEPVLQRQGVATQIYAYAAESTGLPVVESETQTPEGKAFRKHPKGHHASPARAARTFRDDFEEAFDRLDAEAGGHNYVLLFHLRNSLPQYDRATFDKELAKLRGAGGNPRLFTLDEADGRHVKLTPEEGEAGIREGGKPLTYAARVAKNPGRWAGSQIQSLLFDRNRYTEAQAKAWAKNHGYRSTSIDTTDDYHRIRQAAPSGGPCRTISFGDYIKAVVCEASTRNPRSRR